jgi:ribonuclease P protein component
LRSQDFKRVVKSGKRRVLGSFVVVTAPRDGCDGGERNEKSRRLGVTVSKRVGNAVVRNQLKRRIREWFRQARAGLPDRSDIVVIARPSARDLSATEVVTLLDRILQSPRARGRGSVAVGIE